MEKFEKIVVVTRKTRLQELIERFNTRAQAKFYIEHSSGDFADYEAEDETYERALQALHAALNFGLKVQTIDRSFLPTFLFAESDIVIALGQDGLVANAAKYVGAQALIGINPDPERFDGILAPVSLAAARPTLLQVLSGMAQIKQATLAEVTTNDGQRMLAFNDLFIGAQTHVSARYKLEHGQRSEQQSSSGVIVSTALGATGWLSSVFNMVSSVSQFAGNKAPIEKVKVSSSNLVFVVREPFIGKQCSANIVAGFVTNDGGELVIDSRMPSGGTIFSDGIESDFIAFNSGTIARIAPGKQKVNLVVRSSAEAG